MTVEIGAPAASDNPTDAGADLATGLIQDPPAGGEPTGPADLEAVAAAFDAEVIGGGTPAATEEGSSTGKGGSADAGTPPPPDPIDQFIQQNYQGDRNAFVASLYETRQESRRLATEVELLKRERATPPRDIEAELKALRESDPEVQALNQELQTIAKEDQGIGLRQLEIAKEANTLQTTIVQLEAQIPTLTDEPKELAKAQSSLYRARTELSAIKAEYDTNEARRAVGQRDYRRLNRELAKAERDLRSQMVAQENQAKEEQHNAEWTRAQFANAFDLQTEKYGLDPKSERYKFAREATRTQLADFLHGLGDDHPGLDAAGISSAVGKLMDLYARAHGIQPRGAGRPPARPAPATPAPRRQVVLPQGARVAGQGNAAPTPGAPAPPRTSDDILGNADLVRKRAEAIFNAASSQSRGLRRGQA